MSCGRRMHSETFEAAFDAAAANCRILSLDDARHFVDKGYVVVRGLVTAIVSVILQLLK